MNDKEMPRYRCHKEVHALKIKAVEVPNRPDGEESDGSMIIVPEEEGYAPFEVSHIYVERHKPQPGGYYVLYQDGYRSFSPAEPFEEGYTRI